MTSYTGIEGITLGSYAYIMNFEDVGAWDNNTFGLSGDYRELVRKIIRYFVGQDAHVLLVPHVYGSDSKSESDVTASAAIYEEMTAECGKHLHFLDDSAPRYHA